MLKNGFYDYELSDLLDEAWVKEKQNIIAGEDSLLNLDSDELIELVLLIKNTDRVMDGEEMIDFALESKRKRFDDLYIAELEQQRIEQYAEQQQIDAMFNDICANWSY